MVNSDHFDGITIPEDPEENNQANEMLHTYSTNGSNVSNKLKATFKSVSSANNYTSNKTPSKPADFPKLDLNKV